MLRPRWAAGGAAAGALTEPAADEEEPARGPRRPGNPARRATYDPTAYWGGLVTGDGDLARVGILRLAASRPRLQAALAAALAGALALPERALLRLLARVPNTEIAVFEKTVPGGTPAGWERRGR